MMFGGFDDGWAYAPMPPDASAAVPTAVLHSKSRPVSPDSRRIGVSFVRKSTPISERVLLVAIAWSVKPARLISLNDPARRPPEGSDEHRKSPRSGRGPNKIPTQPLSSASVLGHLPLISCRMVPIHHKERGKTIAFSEKPNQTFC